MNNRGGYHQPGEVLLPFLSLSRQRANLSDQNPAKYYAVYAKAQNKEWPASSVNIYDEFTGQKYGRVERGRRQTPSA